MTAKTKTPNPAKVEAERAARAERHQSFSIELDCPPGSPRPGDLIDGVLEGTGLKEADFVTGPPFFGEQVWTLKTGDAARDARFTANKPVYKGRIEKLYHAGFIRWGSW